MGFFQGLWKGLKFAASATVGIPLICVGVSGLAYVVAESGNLLASHTIKSRKSNKGLYKNPFFEAVSNACGSAFNWSVGLSLYAPTTIATPFIDKTTRDPIEIATPINDAIKGKIDAIATPMSVEHPNIVNAEAKNIGTLATAEVPTTQAPVTEENGNANIATVATPIESTAASEIQKDTPSSDPHRATATLTGEANQKDHNPR